MDDKGGKSQSLINLGCVLQELDDIATALNYYKESFTIDHELDNKPGMANVLLSLGLVYLSENNAEARQSIINSLRLRQETGEQLY